MARCSKFRIYEVEGLYYQCSQNKGADQLCGYREADLRLCFRICKNRFSHNEAHVTQFSLTGSGHENKFSKDLKTTKKFVSPIMFVTSLLGP